MDETTLQSSFDDGPSMHSCLISPSPVAGVGYGSGMYPAAPTPGSSGGDGLGGACGGSCDAGGAGGAGGAADASASVSMSMLSCPSQPRGRGVPHRSRSSEPGEGPPWATEIARLQLAVQTTREDQRILHEHQDGALQRVFGKLDSLEAEVHKLFEARDVQKLSDMESRNKVVNLAAEAREQLELRLQTLESSLLAAPNAGKPGATTTAAAIAAAAAASAAAAATGASGEAATGAIGAPSRATSTLSGALISGGGGDDAAGCRGSNAEALASLEGRFASLEASLLAMTAEVTPALTTLQKRVLSLEMGQAPANKKGEEGVPEQIMKQHVEDVVAEVLSKTFASEPSADKTYSSSTTTATSAGLWINGGKSSKSELAWSLRRELRIECSRQFEELLAKHESSIKQLADRLEKIAPSTASSWGVSPRPISSAQGIVTAAAPVIAHSPTRHQASCHSLGACPTNAAALGSTAAPSGPPQSTCSAAAPSGGIAVAYPTISSSSEIYAMPGRDMGPMVALQEARVSGMLVCDSKPHDSTRPRPSPAQVTRGLEHFTPLLHRAPSPTYPGGVQQHSGATGHHAVGTVAAGGACARTSPLPNWNSGAFQASPRLNQQSCSPAPPFSPRVTVLAPSQQSSNGSNSHTYGPAGHSNAQTVTTVGTTHLQSSQQQQQQQQKHSGHPQQSTHDHHQLQQHQQQQQQHVQQPHHHPQQQNSAVPAPRSAATAAAQQHQQPQPQQLQQQVQQQLQLQPQQQQQQQQQPQQQQQILQQPHPTPSSATRTLLTGGTANSRKYLMPPPSINSPQPTPRAGVGCAPPPTTSQVRSTVGTTNTTMWNAGSAGLWGLSSAQSPIQSPRGRPPALGPALVGSRQSLGSTLPPRSVTPIPVSQQPHPATTSSGMQLSL